MFEKTIGVIGLGRIGALVCERLHGFGATLIGYDPYVQPARAAHMGVELTTLEDVMARSDFITVHIPRTPETTGMISAEQFAMAKPEVRIVNASRSGIIDEAPLVRALETGATGGAGLDVFVNEPPVDSPLLNAPNVILTPHLGRPPMKLKRKLECRLRALSVWLLMVNWFPTRQTSSGDRPLTARHRVWPRERSPGLPR